MSGTGPIDGGEVRVYQAEDGTALVEVRLERDTVWLTQAQMAELFGRERSVITKHVRNVFREGELAKESNVQNLHIAGSDKPVGFYSLNVIISVGYRVKSLRGTQFRIWVTQVLRDHLVKGYSVNAARLRDLRQAVRLVAAALFLWYLERNGALLRDDGTPRMTNGTLVALTLMIAESRPEEMGMLVRIVMHLLAGGD